MSTKKLIKALGLIIVVALLAAVLPLEAKAEGEQPQTLNVAQWDDTVPLVNVSGRETVLKDGDTYHMWYSSSDETKLYHTSSADPASFSVGAENTFTGSAPVEVGSVSVVKEGGIFYMVAYGPSNKTSFAIYTSENGTAWNYNSVIFDGTDKFTGLQKIDGPFLLKTESGFRLYFQVGIGEPYSYDIYVAESNSIIGPYVLGTTNPVLTNGTTGTWDSNSVMHPWVVEDNGNFYMWYSGHGGSPQSLGMAKSTDGYTWVKSPANPIFDPATGYAEPSVITDGDTWQMWTMGTGLVINYLTAAGPFEFQSIQAAIDAASAGDTVLISDGSYLEHLSIDKPLTLKGASKQVTIIQFASTTGSVVSITSDNVRLENLGFSTAETLVQISDNANGVIIQECRFYYASENIYFINNQTSNVVNASPNWWSSTTGPAAGKINGSVTYNPWCYNDVCTALWVAPGGSIQDAIDAAPEGGVVHVAAGTYDEENILITKGITLQGAGAANTLIAPSTTTNNSTIVVRNPSGDVTIDGFNFVMKPKVDYGSAVVVTGETISIDSATVTISNNVVTGSDDGEYSDFGFYGQGNNAKIIITGNTINKTGDNPITMEQQFGSTTVENNTIYITDSPDYDAYYSMIYNNETVNTPQIVQNNVFHLDHAGTGYSQAVTFTTAVLNPWYGTTNDAGYYTDIRVLNNTIYTEGSRARGIGLNDRSAVLGNGTITGAVVTGNKIIGEAATDAETYGITLRGDIQGAVIQNNEISNVNVGFRVQKNLDSGETLICSSGTDFSLNKVTSVTIAAQNTDCTAVTVDASPNWWGSILGPASGQIVGTTTFTPWCGDEDCSFLVSEGTEGEFELDPTDLSGADVQTAINSVPAGSTIVIPEGSYAQVGAFTVSTPNLTIKLSDGTVIQNSSPCFEVTADNVTITSDTLGGGKCVPTATDGIGDHGIVVNDGVSGLRVVGIEIDGTGQTTGDGIHFNGAITDFQILNNYIHDLDGDGVFFAEQPTGTPMDIQGNLFQNNDGVGINNGGSTAIDATYNSWGSYGGPNGTDGDGVSANVTFDPWTHVDLYMLSTDQDWQNKVAKYQQISYTVYGNLQNVMGADFVLDYPETLLACLGCTDLEPTNPDPAGAFETETITVNATAGTIHYVGYNAEIETDPISGTAVALFTVTFEARDVVGTDALDLVETSDLFSMAPPAGPSNNIYAAALVDGEVEVIDIFDVTGIFSMQGRMFRGGIPVKLTGTDDGFPYGPFEASSLDELGINWSVSSIPAGGYLITTNQPRYLNITADLNKQFTLSTADYSLPALELKGGNVVDTGEGVEVNTVDISDASLIGTNYSHTGDDPADANFDLKVNIFDLAMVGGNYTLTSATAYTSWDPQPED